MATTCPACGSAETRLMRDDRWECSSCGCDWNEECATALRQQVAELEAACKFAADDAEPVTEEWFGEPKLLVGGSHLIFDGIDICTETIAGGCIVQATLLTRPTRGQVRRLLSALGITTKEGAK